MDENELVKLYIDLPNHWAVGGESLWAEPLLGEQLFKIENIPFYAYGLNYHDIVLAIEETPIVKPQIKKVVKPSGHRTFRVAFPKETDQSIQATILDSIENAGISYERVNRILIAIDITPEADYDSVYDQLEELSEKGILDFETCEERIQGSFDDLPEEE